jgi:Protein of Unknown function (DUF2784)
VRTLGDVYGVLADAVAVVHFAFLAFVVFGGFLAWRWPWMIWAHLVAAGWGVLITVFSMNCPLTHVENELRTRAGEPELAGGFIDTYVEGVFYPERYVNEARALAAVVVLVSWLGLVARHRRRAQQPLVEHHRNG